MNCNKRKVSKCGLQRGVSRLKSVLTKLVNQPMHLGRGVFDRSVRVDASIWLFDVVRFSLVSPMFQSTILYAVIGVDQCLCEISGRITSGDCQGSLRLRRTLADWFSIWRMAVASPAVKAARYFARVSSAAQRPWQTAVALFIRI